jgi:deoxyribodipyrimidine photo-lyase
MSTVIHWFRNDLRLADNPALAHAAQGASQLVPVFCHPPAETTRWGFERVGPHRRSFVATALADLDAQLRAAGSALVELAGDPTARLIDLARQTGASRIVCEAIPAPEEEAQIAALRAAGISVETHWQSTLLDPATLPFDAAAVPDVFTAFRQKIESAGIQPPAPIPTPRHLPPLPENLPASPRQPADAPSLADPRSAFPYAQPAFHGGASVGRAHVAQYLARGLPHSYKTTRNRLAGIDDSSKFSPWLALGALSARQIHAGLKDFEARRGASNGTYWLWFELLWRDHFRLLHRKHGRHLYRAGGLTSSAPPPHDAAAFARWQTGHTGHPLIDAGMRELAATGYLSNRMRQIVASYLIHDLSCDWRAGAAWFEAQLVDFDVCSNQGNWLYIAGRGTDPRGGRRFNPDKQAAEHDPDGAYQARWSTP